MYLSVIIRICSGQTGLGGDTPTRDVFAFAPLFLDAKFNCQSLLTNFIIRTTCPFFENITKASAHYMQNESIIKGTKNTKKLAKTKLQ